MAFGPGLSVFRFTKTTRFTKVFSQADFAMSLDRQVF